MTNYSPAKPYELKSGAQKGKVLEQLIFTDTEKIRKLIFHMGKVAPVNHNLMQKHLAWILRQSQLKKPVRLCRFCQEYPVSFFTVLTSDLGRGEYAYSFGTVYTCCSDEACRDQLEGQAAGRSPDFYPLEIPNIYIFSKPRDRANAAQMFRDVFEFPKRLTKDFAFTFFKE